MIADSKHYIATKDSGIEWLGKVPAHWTVGRVKRHYAIQLGKMLQPLPRNPQDVLVPYLKARNVQWFGLDTSDVDSMYASSDDIGRYGVETGDLLVCEGGEGGRCALAAGIQGIEPCIIQNALHRVRPHSRLNERAARNDYLQFILSAVSSSGWFDALNDKATIAHFTAEKFGALPILMPPVAEQTAIARVLDHATDCIDRYIRAKEKLIALLGEYKQVLVHDAVTGRIDVRTAKPHPEYKPSGTDWLGDVPAHWDVRRLCTLVNISTGGRDTVDAREDGRYPFFVRSQTVERIETWTSDEEAVLTAGDGVGVGRVFHHVDGRFDFHQRVYKFSDFRGILGRVFYHSIRALLRFEVMQGTAKSTVDSLRLPRLRSFPMPVPPSVEQPALREYIDEARAKIHQTVCNIRNQIACLREYRTRLIADVVTGKLDVRKAASELPNPNPGSNGTGNETIEAMFNPRLPDSTLGKEANP